MTYSASETSIDSGSPLEIYRFYIEGGEEWLYCSGDIDITYQGKIYQTTALSRDSLTIEGSGADNSMVLRMPRNNDLATRYISYVPATTVWVTVSRFHRDDLTDARVIWQGRLRNVSWQGSEAEVSCDLIASSLKRQGPTRLYQRLCSHMLYDHRCKVNPSSFSVSGAISIVDAFTISLTDASSQANGFWVPGYITRNGNDHRTVVDHDGTNLTLNIPYEGLVNGEVLVLFAGCDRSKTLCNSRFSNTDNYGGFPYLPTKNPYEVGLEG